MNVDVSLTLHNHECVYDRVNVVQRLTSHLLR